MAVDVMEDSNLILLLGLDPSHNWTVAEVNAVLDQKRGEWNRRSSQAGKLADEARRCREVLKKLNPDIILASSSALVEHLHKAREISDRQRKQYEDVLDEEIRFASAKGYILPDERTSLEERYTQHVSPGYVEERLHNIPDEPPSSRDNLNDQLRKIDELLGALKERSLYSFLEMPETASIDELKRAADEKARDARNHRPGELKYEYQKTLASEAKLIFTDETKRIQYDRHFPLVQFMQSVLNPYLPLCDLSKQITLEQVEYLLEQAGKDKWEDGEAQQMLFTIALSRGWRVQVPAARSAGISAAQQRLVDELRNELNEAREQKDALDRQRRKDIKNLADSERRRKDAEREAREASEERDRVRLRLQAELDRAKQQQAHIRDLEGREREAEQHLRDLRAGTTHDQERLKKLAEDKQQLEAQLQEARARQREQVQERVAELGPRLNAHITRHELIAARAIIKSFLQVPPQWQADEKRVEVDIGEATHLFQQAKAVASRDPLRAEQLLDSALALCADLEDALQLRRGLLPVAPSELDVVTDDQGVALTWSASPSRDVRYAVIRKEGSKPTSIHDGARIAETSAARSHDDTPPPARMLWYAVYAERVGTGSTGGAHASKALFLLPEVADLRRDVEDGRITLMWRSPAQVSAIFVVRREGTSPRGIDDGKRYDLGSTERFQDSDVQNGVRYFYRVYCEYLDAAYTLHHSAGKLIDAIPESPPQEVPSLEVRGSQGIFSHTVSLIVGAPLRGELHIYRSDGVPDVPASRRVPVHALDSVFGRTGRSLREMSDTLFSATHAFYTPVIIFHDTAYLGESREYTYTPRLTNVRAETAEQTIRVQWKWAVDCEGAEVSCIPRGVHTVNPRVEHVARTEGKATNPHVELRAMPRGDYDITVRARYQLGKRTVFSDSEHVSVHVNGPIVIRYAVRAQHRTFGGKQYQLVLVASEPLSSTPSSIIVMRSDGRPPATPSDGVQVPVPAAQRPDDATWIIPLNGSALRSGSHIAVFPASPQQQDIRYEPESLDSQRIP